MLNLYDIKEKLSEAGLAILAVIFGIPIFLGAPFTFVYLIREDAAYYHSFLGWGWIIILDGFAAGTWPFYWVSRLIFGG